MVSGLGLRLSCRMRNGKDNGKHDNGLYNARGYIGFRV